MGVRHDRFLRIAAELSGDEGLQATFRAGKDIHAETARRVLGREPTAEDRQLARTLISGLLYGAGSVALAASLRAVSGVTMAEAARLREAFFQAYPGLRAWQEAQTARSGPVRTPLGRLLRPKEPTDRLIYPIQAMAADGLKLGLAQLWAERSAALPLRLVAVAPDAVLLETPVEVAERVRTWAGEKLGAGMQMLLRQVPVVVEARLCRDWSGAPVTGDAMSGMEGEAHDHG